MVSTLVVKATAGVDTPERCRQAFDAVFEGLRNGVDVSFWLAGEASWFALPGGAGEVALPGPTTLSDLLATAMGGSKVTLCRGCAARRGITFSALLPHIRMAGAAVFVEECLEATHAVVY